MILKMEYKEQLDTLRQQMPIGIRQGLDLLRKTGGDIVAARSLFEEEITAIIISKTSVSREVAQKHLKAANYDIPKTLVSIEEERFSLPERILRNTKDKEAALSLLAQNLEDAKGIKRDHWLALDQLQHLSPVQQCLLVVMDWLDYEDYEGFDAAIYFYLDLVITQIEAQLLLPELADTLRHAGIRRDEIKAGHRAKNAVNKSFFLVNKLSKDRKLLSYEDAFKASKSAIVDKLYDLVTNNIKEFQ